MKQHLLHRLLLLFVAFIGILPSINAQNRVNLIPTITFDAFAVFPNQPRDTIRPKGPNRWIVNNQYFGSGDSIPETTSQLEVENTETITNPNGNYLHILSDTLLRQRRFMNASYDPQIESENFSFLWLNGSQAICTADFQEVTLSFFYTNPSETAEVELYYNLFDGQGWKKYERFPSLANQKLWKKIEITDTLFSGKRFIGFGFNFKNKANPNIERYVGGIGIDDFAITGIPHTTPPTVEIKSDSAVVCLDDVYTFTVNHSRAFCGGGFYQFFISGSNGSFDPPEDVGFIGSLGNQNNLVNFSNVKDFKVNVPIMNNNPDNPPIVPSKCYRMLVRIIVPNGQGGFQILALDSTDCFEVKDCGSYTRVQMPPVLRTADSSICRLSSFDVPFTSNGSFNFGNKYIAQLSDINGSFANPIEIGSVEDDKLYQGTVYAAWGKVGVKIPAEVTPGCGYKIRVISTSPRQNGRGETRPFCITSTCDIEANKAENLPEYCVKTTDSFDETLKIPFSIHRWGDTAVYSPDNRFRLFLYDRATLQVRNTRPIELKTDKDGEFVLELGRWPEPNTRYGLVPGSYYAEIAAFDSTENGLVLRQTSQLFKFAFGVVPGDMKLQLADSVVCKGPSGNTVFAFCLPGFDFSLINNGAGEYRFYSAELFANPEDYFVVPAGAVAFLPEKQCWGVRLNLGVINEQVTLSFFNFRLKYFSNMPGCESELSPSDTVTIQSGASNPINFVGIPETVCLQDTAVRITAKFWEGTDYEFEISPEAEIIEQTREGLGNIIKVRFPAAGNYRIKARAFGECTIDSTETVVRVGDIDNVRILPNRDFPDYKMCMGEVMVLVAAGAETYTWEPEGLGLKVGPRGETAEATPNVTTTYTITGRVGNCTTTTSVTVTVMPRPNIFTIDSARVGGVTKAFINRPRAQGERLQWYRDGMEIPGGISDSIIFTTNGVYSLEVISADGCKRTITKTFNWTSRANEILNSIHFTVSPNPFRGQTNLSYTMPDAGDVAIDVYDLQGRLLKNIVSERQAPGEYNYSIGMKEWGFVSGTYLVKVKVGNSVGSVRIIEVE